MTIDIIKNLYYITCIAWLFMQHTYVLLIANISLCYIVFTYKHLMTCKNLGILHSIISDNINTFLITFNTWNLHFPIAELYYQSWDFIFSLNLCDTHD